MLRQFCITWQYRKALCGSLVTGGETDRTRGAGTCETTEGRAVVASPDARARGKTVSRLKGMFYAIGEEEQAQSFAVTPDMDKVENDATAEETQHPV